MPTIGAIAAHMAKQHSSKPVTKSDKAMSKIHKKHRKAVEKMPDGSKKRQLSEKYNLSHAAEHLAAISPKSRQKVAKKLAKMGIKIAKKHG